MRTFTKFLNSFTELIGRLVSCLLLFMMFVTCMVVAMRYFFQAGNIVFLQESVSYMHAAAFMLGAAWTLKNNGHVRVDIFYRRMNLVSRAWIDALGALLFLLPFSTFLLFASFEFVGRSWSIREASGDAGGIPYVYVLKTLIPTMCVLLILQGIAELLRNGMLICFKQDDQPSDLHLSDLNKEKSAQ